MSKSYHKLTPLLVGGVAVAIIVIGIVIDKNSISKLTSRETSNQNTSIPANVNDQAKNSSTDLDTTTNSSNDSNNVSNSNSTNSADDTSVNQETLTVSADYNVPEGGINSIKIIITLNDEIITDVSADHEITEQESRKYINSFDANLKSAVVGKNINNLSSSRIGSASLTSAGFYKALNQI